MTVVITQRDLIEAIDSFFPDENDPTCKNCYYKRIYAVKNEELDELRSKEFEK